MEESKKEKIRKAAKLRGELERIKSEIRILDAEILEINQIEIKEKEINPLDISKV